MRRPHLGGHPGHLEAVTRVTWNGKAWKQRPVVQGLPSGAAPDGGFATGVDGVSALNGALWAVETYVPPEAGVPTAPPWNTLGKLLCVTPARPASPPTSAPWSTGTTAQGER